MSGFSDQLGSAYQLKLRDLRLAADSEMQEFLGRMRSLDRPGADLVLLQQSAGKLADDAVARCEAAIPELVEAHLDSGHRDPASIASHIQTQFVDVALSGLPGAGLYASVRGGAAAQSEGMRIRQGEDARFSGRRASLRSAVPHYVGGAIGKSKMDQATSIKAGKIFIGHGHSPTWRVLKDFIQDRLRLPWDEFNREAVAGLSTKERLQAMLSEAAFAFLVMTGEDEGRDGSSVARANVIHEVGLFQGRLGFERAIVMLEDGCQEFSNIVGLSQLRFPKNTIGAAFEDVRRVLEREGMVSQRGDHAANSLTLVRASITRTASDPSLPVLDVTVRNAGTNVAVITSVRVSATRRWHIGPTWVAPLSLEASRDYNVAVPGFEGDSLSTDLSQEVRPQTADRFQLTLGPGADDKAWDPPLGIFVFVLQVELEYNEDHRTLRIPAVFTHIPPPVDVAATTHFRPSNDQLESVLTLATAAKASVPHDGIIDPSTVKAIEGEIDSLKEAINRRE